MIKEEDGIVFQKDDYKKLEHLHSSWVKYNKLLKRMHSRASNIPEVLTEGIICYIFSCKRLLGKNGDAINKKGELIEIKATSSKKELSSFSPKKPYWKKFYFLDFYDEEIIGKFKIYDLSAVNFDKIKITKTDSLKDQRDQGKRPRFSIRKKIISPRRIKPIVVIRKIKFIKERFKPYCLLKEATRHDCP